MKKKFSLSDIEIIQDKDVMENDMLSKILGGANVAALCLCKCGQANCYFDDDIPPVFPPDW